MIDERFPEGLLRVLQARFSGSAYADCEEAISIGFEKLLLKGAVAKPEGYVTTVAVNAMQRFIRDAAYERLSVDGDDEALPVDYWSDPTFDAAAAGAAYDFIRQLVERWETTNVRTTTLLVIAAAKLGEPMTADELADHLEELLDQDVLSATARQWKKRGLDRLRAELIEAEILESKENA